MYSTDARSKLETASATVTRLVTALKPKGAFIATVNSEKLPNGKVHGSITVRIPPEQLDELVASLRTELGKLGRERVEQELAWSHQERAYLGVYRDLISRGKARKRTKA